MPGKSKPEMRLSQYEEAIGTLLEIVNDGYAAIARMERMDLVLPLEMEEKLLPLVGLKIGILRTDVLGKEYLVRAYSGSKTDESSVFQEGTSSVFRGDRSG